MNRHTWARLALVCNLLSAVLLFWALQFGTTDLRILTKPNGQFAFCVGPNAAFVMDQNGGLGIGTRCPDWGTGKPAAMVNTSHPTFVKWGFLFLLIGFFIQLLIVESPEKTLTRAERRRLERNRGKIS